MCCRITSVALFLCSLFLPPPGGATALDDYVATPAPSFAYSRYHTELELVFGYRAHFLQLVSQSWRAPGEVDRSTWVHELVI